MSLLAVPRAAARGAKLGLKGNQFFKPFAGGPVSRAPRNRGRLGAAWFGRCSSAMILGMIPTRGHSALYDSEMTGQCTVGDEN